MTGLMRSQVSNIKQLTNLIWLVTCIVNGETIGLSKLVTYWAGDAQAASRVTRIRRWLMNPLVDPWRLYEPLLKHILRDWQAKTVSVILDGSMVFGDRLQIFRLSLAHGSSTHIHLRTGRTIRLDALTIKPGRILCFNTVRLTLVHQFVTHVSITGSCRHGVSSSTTSACSSRALLLANSCTGCTISTPAGGLKSVI